MEREPLVAIGRSIGARIVSYSFIATVEDALHRNASRGGRARIVDVGIYAVAKRLVLPDEAEGFDQRFEVRLAGGAFVVTPGRRR